MKVCTLLQKVSLIKQEFYMIKLTKKNAFFALPFFFILTACGGGGGDGQAASNIDTTSPTANVAPTIGDMPSQESFERENFSYTPTVSDSDGSVAEYKWEQLSGITIDNGFVDSMESLTFSAPAIVQDELVSFKLTITDNDRATTTKNVEIKIKAHTNIADVTFSDSGLAQCFAADTYTDKDIMLADIQCDSFGITSIDDLTIFTNLTQISLKNNQITDVTTIAEMPNLKMFIASNNLITDINAIEQLTELDVLSLEENQISDIAAVSQLTKLKHLSLRDNQIRDISPLSELINLEMLLIDENPLANITALTKLTMLGTLWLGQQADSEVSDLSTLSKLTNLTSLIIYNDKSTDLSWISSLTKLTDLNLHTRSVIDTAPLNTLINLQKLRIGGFTTMAGYYYAQLSDVNFLSYLSNLESLTISLSQVSDISGVASLTKLKEFQYDRNNGVDLSPLKDLVGLKIVNVSVNYGGISDLSPLEKLVNLEQLYIVDKVIFGKTENGNTSIITVGEVNTFFDLSVLANKTKLSWLSISGEVTDLSPLANLPALTQLSLPRNQLLDVSALAGLTNLAGLYLDYNQISSISPLAELTNLTQLNLSSNDDIPCAELDNIESILGAGVVMRPASCLAD